jgi:predicted peptidase
VCGGIVKPETAASVRQSPLTTNASDPYAFVAGELRKAGVPIWLFHGADDPVIPVSESRRMFDELKKRGADVQYTEYPGVGHNAWDPAYSTEELWTWMLSRSRSR